MNLQKKRKALKAKKYNGCHTVRIRPAKWSQRSYFTFPRNPEPCKHHSERSSFINNFHICDAIQTLIIQFVKLFLSEHQLCGQSPRWMFFVSLSVLEKRLVAINIFIKFDVQTTITTASVNTYARSYACTYIYNVLFSFYKTKVQAQLREKYLHQKKKKKSSWVVME